VRTCVRICVYVCVWCRQYENAENDLQLHSDKDFENGYSPQERAPFWVISFLQFSQHLVFV
jgi:hypothetical protein